MTSSATQTTGDASRQAIEQIRHAAFRQLGIEVRDEQIRAGRGLLCRTIVEMPTGEGKTLTTAIGACLMSVTNRTSHQPLLIATANDYLAARDADWMGPIYAELGINVKCVTSESSPSNRTAAYVADVVYGTLREFAFDYLRRSMDERLESQAKTNRGFPLGGLIIDEADSVLIDEARSPMIITAQADQVDSASQACYRWCARIASDFQIRVDYVRLPDSGAVALTESGRRRVTYAKMPASMGSLTTTDILHALERALWINETLKRNEHYVVEGNQIRLIDEYTGRQAIGKSFGNGIHQAVQAREDLALTCTAQPVARISVQEFVNQFRHVAGLTATAWEDRRELAAVFGIKVNRIPAHRTVRRQVFAPVICPTQREKWASICDETQAMIADRRAVLIGTRTIEQSERLSQFLTEAAIEHVVLNARNHRQEASIVLDAGQPGRVTVATNMAGRGTDIRPAASVSQAGGLHVIVSEPHAAARIDRQLIGRCARQGDPGTARIFASAEDQILIEAFGQDRASKIGKMARGGGSHKWLWSQILKAQWRLTRLHRLERARLSASDARLGEAMRSLGMDPHLDPLPDAR